MVILSRTYNGGKILEYIYTVAPEKGDSFKQSVFIEVSTGKIIKPDDYFLQVDRNNNNTFTSVCCNSLIKDECEGWITENESCWVTASGLSWATP